MPQMWHTEEHGFVKKCCKCEVVYSPTQFHRKSAEFDGLNGRCKWCIKENEAKIPVKCDDERMKHCLESGLDPSNNQRLWEELSHNYFRYRDYPLFRSYDRPCKIRYPQDAQRELLADFGIVVDCDGNVSARD